MPRNPIRLTIVTLLVWICAMAAHAESYRVIVNSENPTDAVSRKFVKDVFLGKITWWEHGGRTRPIERAGDAELRSSFSKAVLQRSVRAVNAYWRQRIFSGRGVPPDEVTSDRDAIALVRRDPGAIAYVSSKAPLVGVKVVEIIE